jgi:glucose-6-phosphate isomerase
MESLGKEHDLDRKVVNQGIVVLGNKGATDQHSYVQQLRDGLNNFFVTFIEVLKDGGDQTFMVEPKVSCGDYLQGFYLGTRQALTEKDRESITITLNEVSPFIVGILIALFERAVGFYASLININAYHQPGVEGGKKAAGTVIQIQRQILEFLSSRPGKVFAVQEIANGIETIEDIEHVFKICEHLSANQELKTHKLFDNRILTRQYGIKII